MSLRNILSGLVALARKGKAKPLVSTDHSALVEQMARGEYESGRYLERPAQPRPPSVSELAEGKRP